MDSLSSTRSCLGESGRCRWQRSLSSDGPEEDEGGKGRFQLDLHGQRGVGRIPLLIESSETSGGLLLVRRRNSSLQDRLVGR